MVFLSRNQTNRRTRADLPDSFLAGSDWPQKNAPVAFGGSHVPYANHKFHYGFDPERTTTVVLQLALDIGTTFVDIKVVLAEEDGTRWWQARHLYRRPQKAFRTRWI